MTNKILLKKDNLKSNIKSNIAIIVPYRDQIKENRKIQLKIFIDHMTKFLKKYDSWKIFIIKQTFDNNKFNRGKLLNIGYKIAEKEGYNTFIFHDVDLLPENNLYKLYTTYPELPIHIGSLWKTKYDYPTFVGGVISINKIHYKKINGFPNIFWGWGGEDDAFYFRLKINKIDILEPLIKDWGKLNELKHGFNPDEGNSYKKENRNSDKFNWKKNGLSNLNFSISKQKKYKNVSKIYVNLIEYKIPEYFISNKNVANNKQELKNLINYQRQKYEYLKNEKNKFKNTLKFLIKYYSQGTYVYIENNKIEIFSSFNFDDTNYLNMELIQEYFIKINNILKITEIQNLEFFINTLPFSLEINNNNFIVIVSDIIEKTSNEKSLKRVMHLE